MLGCVALLLVDGAAVGDGPRTLDCSLEFEDLSEARVCCALLKVRQ